MHTIRPVQPISSPSLIENSTTFFQVLGMHRVDGVYATLPFYADDIADIEIHCSQREVQDEWVVTSYGKGFDVLNQWGEEIGINDSLETPITTKFDIPSLIQCMKTCDNKLDSYKCS